VKAKQIPRENKFRKIPTKVATNFRRVVRWAAIPALAAGLMLVPAKAGAEEKTSKRPEIGITFNGGAYNKLKEPFFGVGLDAGYSLLPWLRADASASLMGPLGEGKTKWNEARLGITAQLSEKISMTPWVSHSKYYGDDWEVGTAVHFKLPNGAIHVAPHIVTGGYFPFPIIFETSFGPLGTSLAVVPIVNHGWKERPAPIMSSEAVLSLAIWENMGIYLKGVGVAVIKEAGVAELGAFNFQGGVRFGI